MNDSFYPLPKQLAAVRIQSLESMAPLHFNTPKMLNTGNLKRNYSAKNIYKID